MIVTLLRNPGSGGARRLADALSDSLGQRVTLTSGRGGVRTTRRDRYVINWGVSYEPNNLRQRNLILSNSHEAVANCQDKIATFDRLDDANVACIEHSFPGLNLHGQWLEADGKIVVRNTTTGHSGNGIVIVRRGTAIPRAPLYTRYFKKTAEYRVHVAFGNVILIQQKRKRNGVEQTQEQALIRTHANGWVFSTQNLDCDQHGYTADISRLAVAAANAIGANHCAVDILTNRTTRAVNSVVCEINSAPGIEAGSTLEAYTTAFTNEIRRHS